MEQFTNIIPLKSVDLIYRNNKVSRVKNWFIVIMISLIVILFLPWTQNIKAKGNITTLRQEQRPQDIVSPIPGKIVKWWVKEGDFVKKGDTILQLSEIKEDYLDPNLVARTQEQLDAKKGTIEFYRNKATTADVQIEALKSARLFKIAQLKNKLKQLENKLAGEKAEFQAAVNDYEMAKDQYVRQQKMFNEGLVSQTQLQQRNVSSQNALSKKISIENKIAQTQQEIINVKIEQNSVDQEYTEKISKTEGDKFQSLSMVTSGEGDVAKLRNQVVNYSIRNGMYFLIAPQNGQFVQAKKSGIGEIVKEGEIISTVVPEKVDYAVEMFVRPLDLPLISKGQKVRFTFDGFPAIIFSGWPQASYGTFGGKVVAYENTIGPNGLFRVLVTPDTSDKKWPEQIRIGGGAQAISLLKDVPIWYEIWRNINGFPPDYYNIEKPKSKESSK